MSILIKNTSNLINTVKAGDLKPLEQFCARLSFEEQEYVKGVIFNAAYGRTLSSKQIQQFNKLEIVALSGALEKKDTTHNVSEKSRLVEACGRISRITAYKNIKEIQSALKKPNSPLCQLDYNTTKNIYSFLAVKHIAVISTTCKLFQQIAYSSFLDLTDKRIFDYAGFADCQSALSLDNFTDVVSVNPEKAKMITGLGQEIDLYTVWGGLLNWEEVVPFCPNLTNMTLNGLWPVNERTIRIISEYCPKLKKISLRMTELQSRSSCLSSLGQSFPTLQHFHFGLNANLGKHVERELTTLFEFCKGLKTVKLECPLNYALLKSLWKNCPDLKSVHLEYSWPATMTSHLTLVSIQEFIRHYTQVISKVGRGRPNRPEFIPNPTP